MIKAAELIADGIQTVMYSIKSSNRFKRYIFLIEHFFNAKINIGIGNTQIINKDNNGLIIKINQNKKGYNTESMKTDFPTSILHDTALKITNNRIII